MEELQKKIEELEKRVKELESKPKIEFIPYPYLIPQITYPYNPPTWPPTIWCGTGDTKSNCGTL